METLIRGYVELMKCKKLEASFKVSKQSSSPR